ncbi:MAG TPA: hypothetical protein VK906_02915 [Egicoccus sp.]|nr:hypothetical protein [Egicoccus sp.]HSK22095.1 hypothetical protein [Egicoccus sp.]
MPVPVVAVLVGVLVATLVVMVVLVVVLVRRLARVAGELRALEQRIGPALADLQERAALASAELDRVGDAIGSRSRDPARGGNGHNG